MESKFVIYQVSVQVYKCTCKVLTIFFEVMDDNPAFRTLSARTPEHARMTSQQKDANPLLASPYGGFVICK